MIYMKIKQLQINHTGHLFIKTYFTVIMQMHNHALMQMHHCNNNDEFPLLVHIINIVCWLCVIMI